MREFTKLTQNSFLLQICALENSRRGINPLAIIIPHHIQIQLLQGLQQLGQSRWEIMNSIVQINVNYFVGFIQKQLQILRQFLLSLVDSPQVNGGWVRWPDCAQSFVRVD